MSFMIQQGKARMFFRVVSSILVITFLWQQISWAGDVIDTTLERMNKEQSQTFAPSYLQNQSNLRQDAVTQKQAIEDYMAVQSQKLIVSSPVQPSDEASLALQGPKGGGGGQQASPQVLAAGSSSGDGAILSITTEAGDVIHYKGSAIDYVEKKQTDGMVIIKRIEGKDFVDADNNLLNAEVTYPDDTVMIVSSGKVVKITKPDRTVNYYNENELIDHVIYADGSVTFYSYTKDGEGNITKTALTDYAATSCQIDADGNVIILPGQVSEKTAVYDKQNKLESVVFKNGKTIGYINGMISTITDVDGTVYTYNQNANSNNPNDITYDVCLELVSKIEVPGKIITECSLDSLGNIINGKVEFPDHTSITVSDGRITEFKYENGNFIMVGYWEGSVNKKYEAYFKPDWTWQRSIDYYEDGVTVHYQSFVDADPSVAGDITRCEYDTQGRRILTRMDDESYIVTSYWGVTTAVEYNTYFKSGGVWEKSIGYAEDGMTLNGYWAADTDPSKTGDITYCTYDSKGRIIQIGFDTGDFDMIEYWGDTSNKKYYMSLSSDWTWNRSVGYQEDGVTLKGYWARDIDPSKTGDVTYCGYDTKGRMTEVHFDNGNFDVIEYWGETSNMQHYISFESDWTWKRSIGYAEDGVTIQGYWAADADPSKTGDITYCGYDSKGRLTEVRFDAGNFDVIEYWGDTSSIKHYISLGADWTWKRSVGYYEDGITIQGYWAADADLSKTGDITYCGYDSKGRLTEVRFDSGNFDMIEYWGDTSNMKYYMSYESDWTWNRSIGYYEDGVTLNHIWLSDHNPSAQGDIIRYDYDASGNLLLKTFDSGDFLSPGAGENGPTIVLPSFIDLSKIIPVMPSLNLTIPSLDLDVSIAPAVVDDTPIEPAAITFISSDGKSFNRGDNSIDLGVSIRQIVDDEKPAFFDVVKYDKDGNIVEVIKPNGETISYDYSEDNISIDIFSGSRTTYNFTTTGLDNVNDVTVDRFGIKRIYDQYGNLQSVSLDDAAQIVYENGKVSQIITSTGKKITFDETGSLDGALISYPDGSMAVYKDSELIQIITNSGELTYDGGIRHVKLSDDTEYDWNYNDDGSILIKDISRNEDRTYKDGKLLKIVENSGTMLTTNYTYDEESGNLKKSEVCKNGDVLYTYNYEYKDNLTIIHDEDGNTQAYNSSKKLTYIIDSTGKEYSYTYVGKSEGYIEVYFPSGVKVRYDSTGKIVDVAKGGVTISEITFDASNNPTDFTYIKDEVTYKVVGGSIHEATSADGTTLYYDNGFIKSVQDEISTSLQEYQYYIIDSKTYKDASFFQAGKAVNVSYYLNNGVATLMLSADSLQFGDGTDGVKHITTNKTLDAGTYNFTSLTIDKEVTLTVPSGTTINCLGTVDIKGIISGSNININAYTVTVEAGASITGLNQHIRANTINNQGNMETLIASGLPNVYTGVSEGNCISGGGEFPEACTITKVVYDLYATGNTDSYSCAYHCTADCRVEIYQNGEWVAIFSDPHDIPSHPVTASLNGISVGFWANCTAIRGVAESTAHADHDMVVNGRVTTIQAYTAPECEYINSTGNVPVSTNNGDLNSPSEGTFESGVIEVNSLTLDNISWDQNLPSGTTIEIRTRTGDTLDPDATDSEWTGWSDPLFNSASSTLATAESKYVQFKITLKTSDSQATPYLNISNSSPLTMGYKRAPINSSELNDISFMTRKEGGITYGYNTNGLLIWTKDASGNVTSYDPPDAANKIDATKLVFDYAYTNDLKSLLPTLILNDTQKAIYMKDDIIVSELTAIESGDLENGDGSRAEYVQGKLSKITTADNAEITNITFDENNKANDFTYVKDGTTYIVRNKVISEVISPEGNRIKYYPYGFIKNEGNAEYGYGIDAGRSYSDELAFQDGSFTNISFFKNNGVTYLEMSDTSLIFGDGSDDVKHVKTDETLEAGTYNFTSLTIDSGATLTVASGVTIYCLDTVDIKGKLVGSNIDINSYTVTIETGGSLTGLNQHIKANTINNHGNMETLISSGSPDHYTSGGKGECMSGGGTFPEECTITKLVYNLRAEGNTDGYSSAPYCTADCFVDILQNGEWVTVFSDPQSIHGHPAVSTLNATSVGNWENCTAVRARASSTASADHDVAVNGNVYTIEAYTAPECEYINSTGNVPVSTTDQFLLPQEGSFESGVIEVNALTFNTLSWSQELVAGTHITIQTRTGNKADPDAIDSDWTEWSDPVSDPDGSNITSACGRYMQYRINLSTDDVTVSPRVEVSGSKPISISYTKFSDSLTEPYVKVKENSVTKAYNKEGVIIWEEDALGNRATYDPATPHETIGLAPLKFNSTYTDTLKDSLSAYKLGDAQKIITIYDQGNDIPVEMVSADQSITYFDEGFATKVVDKNGVIQVQYTYDDKHNILTVELSDARDKLEENYQKAILDIVTKTEDALIKLEKAEVEARANLEKNETDIRKQIADERNLLETQKAQYDESIYDLSAFDAAFAELKSYEDQLDAQIASASSDIATQMADARAKINSDATTAMQKLINDEYNKVLVDIAQKESSPILYQYYRKVLGRDPGNDELLYWMNEVKAQIVPNVKTDIKPIDPTELTQYIEKLDEYKERTDRRANIITSLGNFLEDYRTKTQDEKNAIAVSLGLDPDELVALTESDITGIMSWLNGQSLHFGDSALQTVMELLKAAGINRSFEDVAKEAIKIDILTGVINKSTTGDLMISMYAMRKAAALDNGIILYSQKISYDDLKEQVLNGPVIIHIDGNHYVIVTAIDDEKGTVTYTDTTVGKSGTSITISRTELMQVWKGYALSKDLAHDKDLPGNPPKTISATAEKNIRGSSWLSKIWKSICNFFQKIIAPVAAILLFIPPLAPFAAVVLGINIIIQTISFVVHTGTLMDVVWSVVNSIGAAIGAVVLPNIFDAVGTIFSQIGHSMFASLQGAFQNVMPIFNTITTYVKGIATGIGQILTLGLTEVEIATSIGYNIITQGISLGTNYLFQSMHLDPTLSAIGSALLTGAVMGAISPDTNIVAEALRFGTIAGVNEVGKAIGLDPNITSLAAMLAGSLVGGALDIGGHHLTYDQLMADIAPKIGSECGYIVMTELGEAIGIDPRISYLAGIGIRSGIELGYNRGNGTEWKFDVNKMWGGIQNGLLRGATSVVLQWASQETGIDALLANLSTTAMAGGLEAFLEGRNPLDGIFDTYMKAGTGFLTLGGDGGSNPWLRAAYISQTLDFTRIIQRDGIAPALESYATGYLHQTTINEIWKLGGIAQMLLTPKQVEVTKNDLGEQVKRIYTSKIISDADKLSSNYIDVSLTDDRFMGYREGDVVTHCEFVVGPDGRMQLKKGMRVISLGNGKTRTEYVENFNIIKIEFKEADGTVKVVMSKLEDSDGIEFDANNNIRTGVVKTTFAEQKTEISISYKDGEIVESEQRYDGKLVCRTTAKGIEYGSGVTNLGIDDPTSALPFILDEEVSNIDRNTALANINGAFTTHKYALNDTLSDVLKEYATVFMQEKIIDKAAASLFNTKIMSFTAELIGLKDTLQNGLNPSYESITSLDSQQMYSIWSDFNTEINLSTRGVVGDDYVSIKYDPSLTQQVIEDIVGAGIKELPLISELNLGVPKPGEVEHVALFETIDTGGYHRIIELRFNYGMFIDPSGKEIAGPTYVELTVWKADWPNDPQLALGSHIEKHRSAPWI